MRTSALLLAALAIPVFTARADIAVDPNAPVSSTTRTTTTPAATTSATSTLSTTTTATAPTPSPEEARVAALQQRFAQGMAVEKQGQLQQARAIFDGIIADAPDAKGSLREAGEISLRLGDYLKADDYYSKLHALVPDYPGAIEGLIQANQSLKRDAKVEILLAQLKNLHAQNKTEAPYFVRERIHLDGGMEIVIYQFFDYHQPRYYAWDADLLDAQHHLKRRLTVNYDPEVTATMRKDPKLANAEQFLVVDNIMGVDGHVTRLDVYQQFLALPTYDKMRTILLVVFSSNVLKPIDSAPVPQGR